MTHKSSSLDGIPNALEFYLLSRACADGTPEEGMIGELLEHEAQFALMAMLKAGRLKLVNGGYALTYAGEDRLDELFEQADVVEEDLPSRVLRLMATLADLDVHQISRALGVKLGSATRSTSYLLQEGLLSRRPKPSGGHRGRTAYVYVRAA
ncbi:hypothetical protein [Deinococcus peraridilitoris]|uniref:Uncharacterized protein n=1 Tax=Deinococcus peraridilitoris (strain DSM 19664 / LMG 22246 / CIP 109416 / KR-200) TaxID=937777 RepID=L0A5C5_DEIPD|nr:hypothetical protein [Deinococcus peraridilitoris]AFZ68619.1 hypothetical protein Deipe_3176 [Deinococcus peraridilitoris DSM 19664]